MSFTCVILPKETVSKVSDGAHRTPCRTETDKPDLVDSDETLLRCTCSTSPDRIVFDSHER